MRVRRDYAATTAGWIVAVTVVVGAEFAIAWLATRNMEGETWGVGILLVVVGVPSAIAAAGAGAAFALRRAGCDHVRRTAWFSVLTAAVSMPIIMSGWGIVVWLVAGPLLARRLALAGRAGRATKRR